MTVPATTTIGLGKGARVVKALVLEAQAKLPREWPVLQRSALDGRASHAQSTGQNVGGERSTGGTEKPSTHG